MKKYSHPIDELFRTTLEDHHMAPSDAAKKAFLNDALQLPPPRKNGGRSLIVLSVLLALMGTGIILWGVYSDRNIKVMNTGRQVVANAVNSEKIPATNQMKTNQYNANKDQENPDNHNVNSNTQIPSEKNHGSPHSQKITLPGNRPKVTTTGAHGETGKVIAETKTTSKPVTPAMSLTVPVQSELATRAVVESASETKPAPNGVTTHSDVISPISSNDLSTDLHTQDTSNQIFEAPVNQATNNTQPGLAADSFSAVNKADSAAVLLPGNESKKNESLNKERAWIPDIGIYYSPEWMFNTLEGTKFVNNFGLEGTFHFGKFSIRTGAGLSVAKGTNELIVAYNEFLGEYNKLDSMDFTWSNPAQQYIPKYYMSNQDVWDSLMKLDYAKVIKRYTYLQIPLIMGYDFWQSERVSLGFRVGPVMSVLTTTKQLSATYDPGKNKVISINDISPGQINLNWQLMAGFNTGIFITRRLRFEVEPWAKYYFNSVYEKPANNTKPWSLGVRAGLVIGF